MKNKQTAVEWLYNKLQSECLIDMADEIFNQAKAMEKEQHGETWDKALDAYEGRGYLYVRAWKDFDDYYEETYGKDN